MIISVHFYIIIYKREYFYTYNTYSYCRKCITFGTIKEPERKISIKNPKASYHLEYMLTTTQEKLAKKLLKRYQNHLNTKLKAVCGAGKTEILYTVIQFALQQGHRVCLTVPRRELVKELATRIQQQFLNVKCSVVYGGHSEELEGQLVICTCHQLFRYPKAFDLLILDEEDAFPYRGNEVLQNIVLQSIKGNYIFMSATMKEIEATYSLHTRYHGYPLPIPTCKIRGSILATLQMVKQVRQYVAKKIPILIYVFEIEETLRIQKLLSYFHLRVAIAHSKCSTIQESIQALKNNQIDVIVTTTILERGITLKNVQVIILQGEHPIFDTNTLLQICGRVGRKIEYPKGEITIYANYKTKEIKECIKILRHDNAYCV